MSSYPNGHSLYSLRAKDLLEHPQFSLNLDARTAFRWKVEYSGVTSQFQTDKILTLKYSHQTSDEIFNVFAESVGRLSQGKTVDSLMALSFREIESFLRDENHLASFADEIQKRAEETFLQVKISLIVYILAEKIQFSGTWSEQKSPWHKLSLADKNRAVSHLVSELGKLFSAGKPLELVLAEGDTVTVNKNDFPLDLEIIEGLMGQLFSVEESISALKVVGTL